ncbi:MAG TPA: hypothetical protein VHB21_18265 [Minicystis sp.]|nr:hypothetical protein [Minicystis sp.]
MRAVAAAHDAAEPARPASPWLFGAGTDVAVFGGPAALALALTALAPRLAPGGELPGWAWLAFVLAVDVAHVHTTLFRTYFDPVELRRHKRRYALVPVACWAAGALLHAAGEGVFWRALAYVAVFHFVRQQVGWVLVYRARAGERDRLGRALDAAVVYAATLYPLAYWHAHLPRAFRWFMDGDFVDARVLAPIVPVLAAAEAALLALYAARAVAAALRGGRPNWGKHLVVATTAVTWYVGIVATDSDFSFTVCNVLVHGVPYMALLWAYARARGAETDARGSLVARVASLGVVAFLGAALAFAYVEELAWDRLVWHEAPPWFGGVARDTPLLGPVLRSLVVPLLAVPQATHYALDAVLWRRGDAGRAQAAALGFEAARPRSAAAA